LFRENPALGLRLLQSATDVPLPPGTKARLHAAQFTDLRPPEYAADAACLIEDEAGKTLGALIIEIQLSPDELALLSVAAHGREPDADAIGIAAYLAAGALGTLDTDRGARYADIITAWLSKAARRALEEFMSLHGYEFQSEFAKRYAAEGRKDGERKILIKQLTLKFGELPDGILQQIRAADDEHLERWAERILVARTIDDVFAD
jgi:hypothetical protein